MTNLYDYQLTAIQKHDDLMRAAKDWQRADEALAGTGRRGLLARLFGPRRAA